MSQLLATLADAANTAAAAAAPAAEKPTFLDEIASVIIIITSIAALLTLGGLIVIMMINAMNPGKLSTSWPTDQEQSFIPFEKRGESSHLKAWAFSGIAGVVVLVLALGIQFGVEPAKQCESGKKLDKNGKCSDAQQVDREAAKAEAPKAEAPKAEEKKEEPKAEEKKEEPMTEEKSE
ncbi:MAG: hypothetical protein KF773_28815 [Deltaproteobacteria bacterium]|nr:hypothetical protein [Deltaproteobacteria bacterium]